MDNKIYIIYRIIIIQYSLKYKLKMIYKKKIYKEISYNRSFLSSNDLWKISLLKSLFFLQFHEWLWNSLLIYNFT